MGLRFFFAADGLLYDNAPNLPLGVLRSIPAMAGKKCFFRFALDEEKKKLYVQDGSFRTQLSNGDKDAWGCLNQALMALSKKGTVFPEREYGEPPGSTIMRKLSDYKSAWRAITEVLRDDFGASPPNMDVCEHAGDQDKEELAFSPNGVADDRRPMLVVDRTKSLDGYGDVSYEKINRRLVSLFLGKIIEIARVTNDDRLSRGISTGLDRHGRDILLSIMMEGKAKVVRPKNGELRDEYSLRNSGPLKEYEAPALVFSIEPPKRTLWLHNDVPSRIRKDQSSKVLLDAAIDAAARIIGCSKGQVIVAFYPSLNAPFKTKLSRNRVVWDFLSEALGRSPVDVPILEATVYREEMATPVRDKDSEDGQLSKFRVMNGIEIGYPYIMVDNTGVRPGLRWADIVKAYCALQGVEVPKVADEDGFARYLLRMDVPKGDISDFLADPRDMVSRARVRGVIEAAWSDVSREEALASASPKMTKSAVVGLGLGINDWWQYGLQESLNQGEHSENEDEDKDEPKPFNRKKMLLEKEKHMSYQAMLESQHSKDSPAQKTTEQLLRESQA